MEIERLKTDGFPIFSLWIDLVVGEVTFILVHSGWR